MTTTSNTINTHTIHNAFTFGIQTLVKHRNMLSFQCYTQVPITTTDMVYLQMHTSPYINLENKPLSVSGTVISHTSLSLLY